jgi:hypothetical protein
MSSTSSEMSLALDSGLITPPSPPPSDCGRCPDDLSDLAAFEVNNSTTNSTSPAFPQTTFAQLPPTPPQKSRRDLHKEREANRSKQFTTRLQRSATTCSEDEEASPGEGRRRKYRRPISTSTDQNQTAEALKAVEPLHEKLLTSMAFAEQQKWITVQQKTFTKW